MTYYKSLENEIKNIIIEAGYEIDNFSLVKSGRLDLGDYQINEAMSLAKKYGGSPREIAEKIKNLLINNNKFKDINIAGPGFINFRLTDDYLIEFANSIVGNINSNVDRADKRLTYIVDYGGANVAKTLHVGHLRPANIGEALKRLLKLMGHEVIGDVHFGDSGLQVGQVILEIKSRYPDLLYFSDRYNGEDIDLPITAKDLDDIYPTASMKSKEDENFKNEAARITLEIQSKKGAYYNLWLKIRKLSIDDINKVYDKLNCSFDLFEGELDSFEYFTEMDNDLRSKNLLEISEGATVINIAKEDDKKELPPFMLYKSNGAAVYGTTDLATIYGRVKRFKPDAIWYVVDKRQNMHFEQLFRVVQKAKINEDMSLEFHGFGTMNGEDGKPFKTRSGGVATLKGLIENVKQIVLNKLGDNVEEAKKEDIANIIAIAAIKYADLMPFRETDYIFNPEKFADIEGKTGPYILYALTRIKSILTKADNLNYNLKITSINSSSERNLYLILFEMPNSIKKSFNTRSLNELCDYVYSLTSTFNTLYGERSILGEENKLIRDNLITLIKIINDAVKLLMDVLAIEIPEKM